MIACKICIALKGLKGCDLDTCGYVFKTDEEFYKHLKDEHNLIVIGERR
jgi:4-hydroxy-3-methylbut-2-enyl diphosphate reductase IspH